MALRGIGAGGYSFALPDDYDDAADLSAFLWLRRGDAVAGGSRVFNLINGPRTRGFVVHVGGSASGTSLPTEVVVSVSSGNASTWGAGGNQSNRGRATLPDFTEDIFYPLAFSVRASGAADNTGSGGAQQLHAVWWKGAPAEVANGAVGSGIPKTGGQVTLLCREASNLMAFDGWVAEVAVWQDYRLTAADAARLSRGASPRSIAPEKLLFYRSGRTGVDGEVGDTATVLLGTGGAVETAVHPPLLIEGDGNRHGAENSPPVLMGEAAPVLTVNAGRHGQDAARPGLAARAQAALHPGAGRHVVKAGQAALAAAGRLAPQHGRHGSAAGAPPLLSLAGATEILQVPQEARWMTAGWP